MNKGNRTEISSLTVNLPDRSVWLRIGTDIYLSYSNPFEQPQTIPAHSDKQHSITVNITIDSFLGPAVHSVIAVCLGRPQTLPIN